MFFDQAKTVIARRRRLLRVNFEVWALSIWLLIFAVVGVLIIAGVVTLASPD